MVPDIKEILGLENQHFGKEYNAILQNSRTGKEVQGTL